MAREWMADGYGKYEIVGLYSHKIIKSHLVALAPAMTKLQQYGNV